MNADIIVTIVFIIRISITRHELEVLPRVAGQSQKRPPTAPHAGIGSPAPPELVILEAAVCKGQLRHQLAVITAFDLRLARQEQTDGYMRGRNQEPAQEPVLISVLTRGQTAGRAPG